MSTMYGTIGRKDPEYLLADPRDAEVIAIPCEPGNGQLERGLLMYRDASGMYKPAEEADIIEDNFIVVLEESIDTDAFAGIAEDARAFRAGRMIAGRVTLHDGADITPEMRVILRKQNIVFNQMSE